MCGNEDLVLPPKIIQLNLKYEAKNDKEESDQKGAVSSLAGGK